MPTTPQQRAAAAERQRRSRARRRAEAGLPPARTYRTRRLPSDTSLKACSICQEVKLIRDFPPAKSQRDGRYPYCRPCHAAKSRAWYQANRRRVSLYRKYGREAVLAAERATNATIPHQSKT